jgi:hypothetical protein
LDKASHPSTLRITIWPDASSAQNSIGAVATSPLWYLVRRGTDSGRLDQQLKAQALTTGI